MDPLAASRAYELLAELFSRGITSANRDAARTSATIARALGSYDGDDSVAVDHQHVLGFSVHPYEGAFLDEEGLVGGSRADALAESYRRIGFRPDPTGDDAEHVATELRALAFLCGAEADAAGDGLPDVAARMRDLQRDFLDAHLGRWLPPLAAAVRRSARPFPTALVDQLEPLVDLHRARLGDRTNADASSSLSAPPAPELRLGDDGTGLAEIARFLVTPWRSGIYLSRDDIAGVARAGGVPRGFGERAVMLENALRAAAHLDALPALLASLGAILARARPDATQPWRSRIDSTIAALGSIATAAGPERGDDRHASP